MGGVSTWQKLALVALGGGLGSVARWALAEWAGQRWGAAFPWGTFIANVSGALLLGLLMGILLSRPTVPPQYRLLLGTGLMGGYTTFSSWMYESWALADGGALWRMAGNVVFSVVAGLAAAWLGLQIGRAL
jgi:CrcB protein